MEHSSKPPMAFNPDLVILHTSTNSLRGESTPKEVAEEVINLPTNLKSDDNVSEIISRNYQFKGKS